MSRTCRALAFLLLSFVGACGSYGPTACCGAGNPSLRIVNAFTGPVDVLIDGSLALASLPAGSIGTALATSGGHTLMLRPAGTTASTSQSIITSKGSLSTIAVVRSSGGALASAVLDDTGSVVPAGATKVRVLHMAPSAGVLQVFRTQPDFPTPVSWQFPFTYQSQPDPLSAPFYQSTVGSWEIRVWQTPVGATGWDAALLKIVIPLNSGEKKTVLLLDKPGGGVRYELL